MKRILTITGAVVVLFVLALVFVVPALAASSEQAGGVRGLIPISQNQGCSMGGGGACGAPGCEVAQGATNTLY